MKQIYIIASFLMSIPVFSQLHIKPYGSQDSFVYVESSFLFGEKQIDLSINPSEVKKASLYLRDEAQLLQGISSSSNTGNGMLSVFQEGNASAYTYNYWSSPVQDVLGSSAFGSILYDPLDELNSKKALITSDLNGTSNPLKISDRWIYKFTGGTYSDWIYVGKNFDLLPGEGFTMKGVDGTNTGVNIYSIPNNPGNKQRYDFRGKPHNGTIRLAVEKDKNRLVGNPYPSALDLKNFLEENLSITGVAYFWDSSPVASHYLSDYEGGYGVYSPAGGNNGYVPPVFSKFDDTGNQLHTTGENGKHIARRFAPIGQGFLVEGKQQGTLIFENEYRVFEKENSVTSEFKLNGSNSSETSMIRFNVEFKEKYVRQLLLIHHPDATSEIDHAMDAKNISVLESDAGFLMDEMSYLINVRPFEKMEEIPLFLKVAIPSEVIFHKTTVVFPNRIYLLDRDTKSYYDLSENKLSIWLDSGEYHQRFMITFNNGIDENAPEIKPYFLSESRIFQNNLLNRLEILFPEERSINTIFLFDSLGKKVVEAKTFGETNSYQFSTQNLSNGIYLVKIIALDGRVISKKVIISN
ncbi:MAG: T9SS type A sorting domain-containing protein [Gillisia sp.]